MNRLLLVVAVAAAPHVAHADCGRALFLGTPSETTIPRAGSLYFFDSLAPSMSPGLVATFRGRPGVVDRVKIDEAITRLDYISFDGGELDIELGVEGQTHAVYHLAAALPADPAPRVLQFWHDDRTCFDCANSDAVMLQLDAPVAAVVARWTFDGVSTEWLVVPHTSEDVPGAAVVELGDVDCIASNLDMDEMHAGGHLDLTAIRVDGSRVAVRGLPDRIAEDQMPNDSVGIARAFKSTPLRESPPPPPQDAQLPADWNPLRGLDDAMYAVAAGIALLALGFLVLMRLRPQLRDPNA